MEISVKDSKKKRWDRKHQISKTCSKTLSKNGIQKCSISITSKTQGWWDPYGWSPKQKNDERDKDRYRTPGLGIQDRNPTSTLEKWLPFNDGTEGLNTSLESVSRGLDWLRKNWRYRDDGGTPKKKLWVGESGYGEMTKQMKLFNVFKAKFVLTLQKGDL